MPIMWNNNFLPDREAEVQRNLEKASILFVDNLKHEVNRVGSEIKRYVGSHGIYYKGIPTSQPGDPPHKVTGFLQNSITYAMGKMESKVGSNSDIALMLELGTSTMQARPWLRPQFNKDKQTLANIICTGHK